MPLTPQHRLTFAAALIAVAIALAIYTALSAPMLDISFSADQETGLLVSDIALDSPNAELLEAGMRITHLNGVVVDQTLLIEEPDQLGVWSHYNDLLDKLTQLDNSAHTGSIEARTGEHEILLHTRARSLSDLPVMFWYQLVVGSVGFLIAAGVYAFKPRDPGARHFALAGLGMLTFSIAASIYSTRELILNGDLIKLCSFLNQLGAYFFTAALVALLWVYPKSLSNRLEVPAIAYMLALLSAGCFLFQIYPDTSFSYIFTLLLFSVSFVLAFLQWRKTAGSPVERAALKWYLLSIYLGTGLFAIAILIPVALGIAPPASQGMMFAVFLFMFIGIALGITRYRLFDLDRWWLTAWSWFLGGMLVIGLDALLVTTIGIKQDTSLALSLALVGWGYFPARQWLFARLHRKHNNHDRQINHLVQDLFSAEEPMQLLELWHRHLVEEWGVLKTQTNKGSLPEPLISNDGQSMAVPQLIDGEHLILHHAHGGSRLFTTRDRWTVGLLHQIACRAMDGLLERLKSHEERRRIFGDLHDDVGSKLLSLLLRSQDPESNELARSALQDLRDVVSQPDDGVLTLADVIADTRAEAQDRLEVAGIELQWQQSGPITGVIPVHRWRHVARILRESLNNVIKHAAATMVTIRIDIDDDNIDLSVTDDGRCKPPQQWHRGRGMKNIEHRALKLGGMVEWCETVNGGIEVRVKAPRVDLTASPGLEPQVQLSAD